MNRIMKNEKVTYCPECQQDTTQKADSYFPDDPESFLVWGCTQCGEELDIIPETVKGAYLTPNE